ncbi:CPBP family intramembrane glutamic endopeptidase [Paenibacillus crassostreae]|uniref:Abortive infection protein n=1 Tax=Paenibacillus crassostreae TaxID=1763538 RepID=A0A167FI16_9BACL|nr:CPBP family intramembrane glutamic endopeptidase [Paenibacillus crassostreae]AOZ94384.1 CAAX protease family protein [Paenibacillus crassostreae]OAB76579.1 abortive infection protein [Paenibacillus crassostreae]
MFWQLFILIVIICLPGVYFMLQTEKKLMENEDITYNQRLFAHLILVGIFGAVGAFTVPKISILPTDIEFYNVLKYGFILGVTCSVGNILLYYFYLTKNISYHDYLAIEEHYSKMGILSRVFYGGFVEEVMFRWGIMSLVLWLSQLILKQINFHSIFFAIGISSILFALVHLPSIKMVIEEPKPSVYVYTILGNVWVGIFTGWAFLEAGIFSAIIVHVLFHLLWYPIQKISANRRLSC